MYQGRILTSHPTVNWPRLLGDESNPLLEFRWKRTTKYQVKVIFPLWSLLLVMAVTSTLPWIRWSRRFSLRTLLIAMTLVAALLGAIVWATK